MGSGMSIDILRRPILFWAVRIVAGSVVERQMYSVMVGESPLGHRPALRCFREVLVETLSGLETAQSRELLLSGYGA